MSEDVVRHCPFCSLTCMGTELESAIVEAFGGQVIFTLAEAEQTLLAKSPSQAIAASGLETLLDGQFNHTLAKW